MTQPDITTDPVIRELKYLNSQVAGLRNEVERKRVSVSRLAVGVMMGMFLYSIVSAMIFAFVWFVVLGLIVGAGAGVSGMSPSQNPPLKSLR